MTPAQLARHECANMLPDGACLGVNVAALIDTGQPKTCCPRPSCRVMDGKRCEYYERVVLPLADKPSPHDDQHLQASRAQARDAYRDRHCLRGASARRCPECGEPRPARRRFCQVCASKRRRETYRRHKAEKREVRATVKA